MRSRSVAISCALGRRVMLEKLLLAATCRVSRANSRGSGTGMDRSPAFESCQIYLFFDAQGRLAVTAVDSVSRQPPGLGPALDLPLTTNRSRPPRPSATALGYQPVGIKPMTVLLAGNFAPSSSSLPF